MEMNKKMLPWSPTKAQVYRMFSKLNSQTIKEEIHQVMMKHREKPYDEIKRKKILFHPEFIKLIELFGIPQGYDVPEGFFKEPV